MTWLDVKMLLLKGRESSDAQGPSGGDSPTLEDDLIISDASILNDDEVIL